MPITDRQSAAVLSTLASGVWTALSIVPTPVEDGFDSLDIEWIADFRGTVKTALEVMADFLPGARHGSLDFWLRQAVPTRVGGNVWKVKAHYEGRIISDKPRSVKIHGTAENYTIELITLPGAGAAQPANVKEAAPSVELGYVLVGTAPPTATLGTAGTPSFAPAVRAAFWAYLSGTDARINWPDGWLLEDMSVDSIAGVALTNGVHFVRETWNYRHYKIPA